MLKILVLLKKKKFSPVGPASRVQSRGPPILNTALSTESLGKITCGQVRRPRANTTSLTLKIIRLGKRWRRTFVDYAAVLRVIVADFQRPHFSCFQPNSSENGLHHSLSPSYFHCARRVQAIPVQNPTLGNPLKFDCCTTTNLYDDY